MTMFGAIFEVNSSISKLSDLQGHFHKKDTVDVNKIIMLHPNRKKSPFFEKGRFLVPNSKKLTFSDYFVNKTHKHVK